MPQDPKPRRKKLPAAVGRKPLLIDGGLQGGHVREVPIPSPRSSVWRETRGRGGQGGEWSAVERVLERGRAHRSSVGKKTAVGHVMKCLCGDIQYQLLPFGVSLVRLDVKDWCSLDDVKDQVLTPSTTSDSSQTPGRGSASCRSVWTRREAGMTSCT